ncbi:MAG: glycosyltransferase [Elusimicrobia bacterium]|nr:glycosyltransferase [Elusimicrobiota bacterium]
MQNKDPYLIHFDTGRTWRGGQDQVFLLMKGLKEAGVRQILIAPRGSVLEQRVKNLNITVKNLAPANDVDIRCGLKLRKIVKRHVPGLLHLHTSRALGMASWALRGIGIKKVFTRRLDLPVSGGFFNRFKYGYPDVVVAISGFVENRMKEAGCRRLVRIYSSVDTERFRFKVSAPPKERPRVAMAGELDLRHKDFITFIEAAGKVIRSTGKIPEFEIAGDGRDMEKIKNHIRKMGLEKRIRMSGLISDMAAFMDSTDILVHTVNFEGLGTVILQAMSSGVPVIATGVGGITELVRNGETGYLVGKNDSSAVAEKILSLLEDRDTRDEFSARSRDIIEKNFSDKAMVRKYLSLYQSL